MKKTILFYVFLFITLSGVIGQNLSKSGFQFFTIGDVEAVVLSDGHIPFPSIQPIVGPDTSPELIDQYLKKIRRINNMDFSLNILLLKKGEKIILLDTGVGEMNKGQLLTDLSMLEISPEQVTDIFISHAHMDHIMGFFDKNDHIVFNKANIYISKQEFDFWMMGTPDFSSSKMVSSEVSGMLEVIKKYLKILEPKLTMINDGETILDFITIEKAPGHTKGHIMFRLLSGGEELVCISDLIHDTSLFTNPTWGIAFDWNFQLGISTRIEKLRKLNSENALIFGFHLPYPGIGQLREIGVDSYEWMPKAFASPLQ